MTSCSLMRKYVLISSLLMLLCAIYAPNPLFAQADTKQAVSVDLLVTGATIVTMDPQRHVIENGVIAVRGDTIVAVGPDVHSLAPKGIIAKQTIDAKGKLIMPGLINAHTQSNAHS